jgi:endogenous inhibitor of DNA gyrase (YacG/DUF329 family)
VRLDELNSPFCSDRCRIIDLSNWATDKYVISEPASPGEAEESPASEFDEGSIQ